MGGKRGLLISIRDEIDGKLIKSKSTKTSKDDWFKGTSYKLDNAIWMTWKEDCTFIFKH